MSEYIIECGFDVDDGLMPGELREEVVRCRDCVGFEETWNGWECQRFSGEYHSAHPDGFCYWGERRDE